MWTGQTRALKAEKTLGAAGSANKLADCLRLSVIQTNWHYPRESRVPLGVKPVNLRAGLVV